MSTTLRLTRDSVAAGDDVDAPHERFVVLEQAVVTPADLQAVLAEIAPGYLPRVAGTATWAAYSGMPLMVFSNGESAPQPFWLMDSEMGRLAQREGALSIYFAYLATTPPKTAYEVISLTMRAHRAVGT
jgi:hypothetical protein